MLHLRHIVMAALACLIPATALAQITAPTQAQMEEARGRPAQTFSIAWSDSSVRGLETLARCLQPGTGWDEDEFDEYPIGYVDNFCSFSIRMKFGPGYLENGKCMPDPVVPVQEITANGKGSVSWDLEDKFDCLFDASILGIDNGATKAESSAVQNAQKTLADMAATGTIEIRNQERQNDAEVWYIWRQASAAKTPSVCRTEYAATQINKRSDNVTEIATSFTVDWAQVDHVERNGAFVLIIGKWMKPGEFAAFRHPQESEAVRTFDAMAALRDAC
jgi:hypothetical protein